MTVAVPDTISAEDLASQLGWSPRRLKAFARGLGACRIMGNRMALTQSDVAIIILASKPNMTIEDVRQWLGEDAVEQHREAELQGYAEPTGVVYFIGRANEVKIGFTNNLAKRLTNLRTGTTEPLTVLLTVPAVPVLERYFHEKFAADHVDREWFKASETILNFIARRNHHR